MSNQENGGTPIDDGHGKKESYNVDIGGIKPIDDDGLTESKRKLKQAKEKERKMLKEENLEKRKVITDKIIEKDLNELIPHEVNVVLYGHENVDDTLVDSILKKGQLEPIVVTKNDDEEKYTIISGHRRWMALKHINENKKQPIKLKEDSVRYYDEDNPLPFVEMKARCVVVNLPTPESRILAIIDYNKRRKKRWSQYYNEIRVLHSIYDPEAERTRNGNLKQYSDSSDLKKRYKKEKDSPLSDNDYYEKLYTDGKITTNDILQCTKYIKVYKRDKKETTKDIADEVDLGRTNVIKLTKIGELAYGKKDKVAIDIMERLDFTVWSLNNAYNVYKLREFQDHFEKNSEIYNELDYKITKVLEATKNHDKNVKESIITDKEVKKYQNKIDEISSKEKEVKKIKDLFSIILIEPDDNTKIEDINASSNSALFVITNPGNFGNGIKLMSKLKYSIQNYYYIDDVPDDNYMESIMLLGTKDFESPNPENRPHIENRYSVYNVIQELYPNQNYHEVPNKYTPKDEPLGWEIPIGKTLSKKQVELQATENERRTKEEAKQAEAYNEQLKTEKKLKKADNKEITNKLKIHSKERLN